MVLLNSLLHIYSSPPEVHHFIHQQRNMKMSFFHHEPIHYHTFQVLLHTHLVFYLIFSPFVHTRQPFLVILGLKKSILLFCQISHCEASIQKQPNLQQFPTYMSFPIPSLPKLQWLLRTLIQLIPIISLKSIPDQASKSLHFFPNLSIPYLY